MGSEFSREPAIFRILKTTYKDCNTPSIIDCKLEQMTVSKNFDAAYYDIRFTVLRNTKAEYEIKWAVFDYEADHIYDIVIETHFINNGEKFSRVYLLDDLWVEGDDGERIIYGAKCRHAILNKLEPEERQWLDVETHLEPKQVSNIFYKFKKMMEEDNMPVSQVCDYDLSTTFTTKTIPKIAGAIITGIDKIIFNDPATIVYWIDGTKTVVKASEHDKFDKETGLAMALVKKFLETRGSKSPRGDFKRLVREADDHSSKR